MHMLAEDTLAGIALIVGALGPSVAAVIVAVRQGRSTRREVAVRHEELTQQVSEVQSSVADAVNGHSRTLAQVAKSLEVGMQNQATLLHLIEERRV